MQPRRPGSFISGGETAVGVCGSGAPADLASSLAAMRFVFAAYLLLIGVGLAFYIVIGIANPQ
jgi:hypothetical protein